MLKKAHQKRQALKLTINLSIMDVQALAFADNHFDNIIATFLFCSVPDPQKGLMELNRVCKPGGQILLLEHVLSYNPIVAALMNAINPLIVRIFGANINRSTVTTVENCQFKSVTLLPESTHLIKLIKIIT